MFIQLIGICRSILRTVLDLIEYLKPLMAIGMSIFSIFNSSPEFQKTIKNARAYAVTLTESLKNCPKYCRWVGAGL